MRTTPPFRASFGAPKTMLSCDRARMREPHRGGAIPASDTAAPVVRTSRQSVRTSKAPDRPSHRDSGRALVSSREGMGVA